MAINFDAAASGSGSGTSLTYSHTCAADATILIVGALNGVAQATTGVTYNGVALTDSGLLIADGGGYEISIWYLISPASGANNIIISINASTGAIFGRSASYTGTATTSPIGASTTASSAGTSMSTSITTLNDNSWTILLGRGQNQNITAGTGSTRRSPTGAGNSDTILFDSNAAISPAGSTTMTIAPLASDTVVRIMFELKVGIPPVTRSPRRAMLLFQM